MPNITPREALDQLLVRALQNPKTTIVGGLSLAGVIAGVFSPGGHAVALIAALIGFVTTTLAKDA